MDDPFRLFVSMDPTVRLMLVVGVALCLTGAVLFGLWVRELWLHRRRRKARRVRAAAPTRVFRPFELADMVRHEQLRREGHATAWASWETVAHADGIEVQTQVIRYDSTGRRTQR